MLACLRENPFRIPQWRWERAVNASEGRMFQPSRRLDGRVGYQWIRKAIRFKQANNACQTDAERYSLIADDPAVFWAYWLWHNQSLTRAVVEAYLLTGLNAYEIGVATGIPPEYIDAFENIFFDVREKLTYRHYILGTVIGPTLQAGISERDYPILWKLYAYCYGHHVLDALVSKVPNPLKCDSMERVGVALQEDAIGTIKLKSAVSAKTIPVNSNTQVELLHAFTKFIEVERITGGASGGDQFLNYLHDMLERLPFCVAGRDPKSKELVASALAPYEQAGIELNYTETLFLPAGITPNGMEQIEIPQFPEPVAEPD